MKKRLAMATIAALAALTLAACGGGAEETTAAATEAAEAAGEAAEEAPAEEAPAEEAEAKEEYVIGMVTYSLAEEFGVDVVDGALAKAEEIGGIEIVYPDAAGDMQKSISIVEDMTTQGIDAICIAPVDADAIIHGTPDDFLWATKSEIINYLIKYPDGNTVNVKVGPLFIQCRNRNLKKESNAIYAEEYIQVKWYCINRDLYFITKNRNNQKKQLQNISSFDNKIQ